MFIRIATLFAAAALCCSTAALAQEQLKTATARDSDYSVARESNLHGTVVKYTAMSATAPAGAHVELQTSSGVVDVHLGNAHLLSANHLSLDPGDSVTIVGENLPFGGGTFYAARVIHKGALSVTLRSKNGIPLLLTPRNTNGQQPAAGAR
jgi:hypothetical protein